MQTVVTGGTGFIGSNLVKKLVQQKRNVIVASDFSRLDAANLTALGITKSDIEFRDTDLTDYAQAVKAVKGAESVFHLAARVGSLEYLHATEMAELQTVQMNLAIDANVFRACIEQGVKKIVYASSCAVYTMGTQYSSDCVLSERDLIILQGQPRTYNDECASVDPDGGYGWAKLLGELQLGWMQHIDIGIARIFNIYGENEPLGEKAHVIADLLRKAIIYSGGDYIVRGDGKQSRDFLYVTDCADALIQLEKKASNPPFTVNIGSGVPVSIATLARTIKIISGKNINIKFDPSKPVGPISRRADMTKSKTALDWQPSVSLEEGLKLTYSWLQRKMS